MSRFVSGGTDEQPLERDEAWLKAQKELDAAAIARQEAGKQEGGKSLYETLQANKAAKQEAFEESTRLTNQFRSLDEDEIEFLDSVQESTRAREAAVKKDTKEHLDEFRRQQEAAERAAKELEQGVADVPPESGENWAAGPRKRKKGREVLGGVKIRRKGSGEGMKKEEGAEKEEDAERKKKDSSPPSKEKAEDAKPSSSASPSPPAPPAVPASLGLGAYSSDEDDV